MYPLISIISPCHNSESFLFRLMDSVLSQTYPNVEMVMVDNDSKDSTANIIKSYKHQFDKKGYNLIYMHEDDLGPSHAINNALKRISGEYLVMADSDDWFATDTYLEKMILKFFDLPEEYGIVRCCEQQIEEGTMRKLGVFLDSASSEDPGTLFMDCLLSRNGYSYVNIGYMLKMSAFIKANGGNDIYAAYNVGQGRQMYLPLYYSYKCYTIKEVMVNYLVRKSSISHGDYSKYQIQRGLYLKEGQYIDGILERISLMEDTERKKYRKMYLYSRANFHKKLAEDNHMLLDRIRCFIDEIKYGNIKDVHVVNNINHITKLIIKRLLGKY